MTNIEQKQKSFERGRFSVLFEYAQFRLPRIKRELGVTHEIIIVVDPCSRTLLWNEDPNFVSRAKNSIYASSTNTTDDTSGHFMYVNFEMITTIQLLEYILYHECLHYKYPKKTELQIRKIASEYLKLNKNQQIPKLWCKTK